MKLPNLDNPLIDINKLSNYVLNPNHPEGRHKARVFGAALGVTRAEADWLAKAIRDGLSSADAILQSTTSWGTLCRVDMDIERAEMCARVRTGWLVTTTHTRLTTCFVIGECDETA